MVVMGPVPTQAAHDRPGGCLTRRRDRSVEKAHTRAPPVPRTVRAKPRANSCGALSKVFMKDNQGRLQIFVSGAGPHATTSSLTRLPSEPACFARKNLLTRELESIENQGLPMGPPRGTVEIREDYSRGHILGKQNEGHHGVPLGDVEKSQPEVGPRDHARKQTLLNERRAHDQELEWVPAASIAHAAAAKSVQVHGRQNTLARERKDAATSLDMPSVRPPGCTSVGGGVDGTGNNYGRMNVLRREQRALGDEGAFPTPRGQDGFGKKNLLVREMGLPSEAKKVAAR
eukprot:TRINITY_DN39635_c0_g1_i1.p1 TRINITY_DN39635_c0_g1~~TRINITY_DN39635_c0_g1_i1.p1  ORF type:complete len:335 (+),score=63.56 TRINITY_DN39635_c0_g1_i1:145-1005(+)